MAESGKLFDDGNGSINCEAVARPEEEVDLLIVGGKFLKTLTLSFIHLHEFMCKRDHVLTLLQPVRQVFSLLFLRGNSVLMFASWMRSLNHCRWAVLTRSLHVHNSILR